MTIGGVFFIGLLAMGPNWAIVDIPYPEAGGGTEVRVGPADAITDALTAYARTRAVKLRKADISEVRIDGPRASARIALHARTELVHLELVKDEWRVVRSE
ncbi:MAG TPA: hypothetical protein VM073_05495 [Usitatibacter sp.]|nr:hypothetical protein [Usitatibacter sp.]